MPYPVISSRRMAYDIDGTEIGHAEVGGNVSNVFTYPIVEWLDSTKKIELNNENLINFWNNDGYGGTHFFWFFFTEKREIEFAYAAMAGAITIQGSNDTKNGIDGSWETASFPSGSPGINTADAFQWRDNIKSVSFSTSYKTIRIGVWRTGYASFCVLHLYGRKAAGETQDDVLICDIDGNELTALKDWGDRPEGTAAVNSFKIKNVSIKIANNVNLQLNNSDYLISLDQIAWQATLDIISIPANGLSTEIFVKNILGPPLLMLGPKAARCIVTVGSFT